MNGGGSSEEEDGGVEKCDLGSYGRLKSSVEEPLELELKPLIEHLEYAYQVECSKLLVFIASDLTAEQKEHL